MSMQLSHGPRVNARTTPRIAQDLKNTVVQMQHDGITFDGRILSTEALVSALLLTFLELSYDDRIELVKNALPDLKKECENAKIPTQK